MARKIGTLDQQRAAIKKTYRRGPRADRRIVGVESLSDVERAVKRTQAVFLKAQGFSHTYIGEAVSLSRKTISDWFQEPEMKAELAKVHADFVDGAVKLLKTYAIEFIEILANIARTSHDEKIVLQAVTEGLDRIGLTKVNKSESAVTSKNTVEVTDSTGLMEALKDAPPEVQQKAAEHLESFEAMIEEHRV